ncbi:MAG: hypothetical protein JXB34_09050 [Bacteroidales bacterium]|nr:hypothetical protein [Bacteroidales bacterium]
MIKTSNILTKPIEQVPTSDEFLEMAHSNSFRNLEQVLKYNVNELLQCKGFNYHMLDELIMILKGYGVLDRLKED